jgi:RNA polymerase sigma factor (sigma-70 family)
LPKPVAKERVIEAVERALERYEKARAQHERTEALRALVAKLTPREREVFCLVVTGRLNKQIAHELGTSERTVKAHRHSIMEKLEVRSVAEMVLIAERLSIFAVPADR